METPAIPKFRVPIPPYGKREKVVEIHQYTNKPTNPEDKKCNAGFHIKLHPIFLNFALIDLFTYHTLSRQYDSKSKSVLPNGISGFHPVL